MAHNGHKEHEHEHEHEHEWDETLTEHGTPATLSEMRGKDFAHLLEDIDGYLCELTGAQIRGGLHILGQLPLHEQLTDLLFSLCRLPNLGTLSIREAIARACNLSFSSLLDTPGRRLTAQEQLQLAWLHTMNEDESHTPKKDLISASDAIEAIEIYCRQLLAELQGREFNTRAIEDILQTRVSAAPGDVSGIRDVLTFVCTEIVPRLSHTGDEVRNILQALDGQYIPAGPSGFTNAWDGPCASYWTKFLQPRPESLTKSISLGSWYTVSEDAD
jgi:cobaltochelatase CobN